MTSIVRSQQIQYFDFEYEGKLLFSKNSHWKTNKQGLENIAIAKSHLHSKEQKLSYIRYVQDFPVIPLTDSWDSVQIGTELIMLFNLLPIVIERCLLMTTDPGDLVLDSLVAVVQPPTLQNNGAAVGLLAMLAGFPSLLPVSVS